MQACDIVGVDSGWFVVAWRFSIVVTFKLDRIKQWLEDLLTSRDVNRRSVSKDDLIQKSDYLLRSQFISLLLADVRDQVVLPNITWWLARKELSMRDTFQSNRWE